MRGVVIRGLLVACVLLAACGQEELPGTGDSGLPGLPDAGGGAPDAGTSTDGGPDAGMTPDAGSDGGSPSDGGSGPGGPTDGGPSDGGSGPGGPTDGGLGLRLFPSDHFTVADPRQRTGRRVSLPLPDCGERPSDCHELSLLNELDGFDVDPTVELAFGQPIDVARLGRDTVFLEKVAGGPRIGLNRLVYSPLRHTLYGRPEVQLEQATEYRLTVTEEVSGVAASTTFTTLSVTAELEKIRQQLDDGSAYAAAGLTPEARRLSFVTDEGVRTVFPASNVRGVLRHDDVEPGQPLVTSTVIITPAASSNTVFAFGSLRVPSWLDADGTIPQQPTLTGQPQVRGSSRIGVTLILPEGTPPEGGWPTAIFGPGITRSKLDLFLAADFNASNGMATLSFDPVGHGYGPRSELEVQRVVPLDSVRFSAHGRGRDVNGDGRLAPEEGVTAPPQPHPRASINLRDGLRQTAADLMALVRAVEAGVDVDGDGKTDLRPERVRVYAQSLGAIYSVMATSVDPRLTVAVFNVPGGPIAEVARLSPAFRERVATELGNRVPSLLNGGREGFTESLPLYHEPPVLQPAQGAVPIQQVLARINWLNRPGSPEAFAPALSAHRLPGNGPKAFFFQFAYGDQTVPNPASATLMRAAQAQALTTFYRNDLTPSAGSDPHGFLLDPTLSGRQNGQLQAVTFLRSEGAELMDPDGSGPTFEVPIAEPRMLERLNFPPPPATGEPEPE